MSPTKLPPMKLAEALLLRADMQKKLARLRERMAANGVVQEGSQPSEDASALLMEAMGVLAELKTLIVRINRTNINAKISDGRSLTEAMAERDILRAKHSLLTAAVESTKAVPDRYSAREIRWVPQLNVANLQKQIDDLSKQLREITTKIQETDWKVQLED